jgi:APA family basic amino acid/polyamine antiporter
MSERKTDKKLSFWDCMGFCIGMIIGSGIMVLTGIVVGLTGHGAPYAFIGAAVLAIFVALPNAFLGSAMPANGAGYVYLKKLIHEKVGFIFLCMFVITQVLIATYAKGFGSYFVSLFPSFNETAVALLALAFAVVVNLVGLKTSAFVQNIMVVFLLLSLLLFIAFGLPQVEWSALTPTVENAAPNGARNFLIGVALLSFATGGAKFIVENGSEIENPGRNIPLSIVLSTVIVAVFYALIGIVASGVLPLEEVAFKNLTLVAKMIFPAWLYVFFIVGGAMFALLTTLNGTLSWVTRGLQAAAKEGWLPEIFARENKAGTPVLVLLIFGVVGATPILCDMDTATIANMGVGLDMLCAFLLLVACFFLPSKYPKEHEAAPFKLKGAPYYIILIVVGILMLGTSYVSLSELTGPAYVAIIVYLIFVLALTQVRYRYVKAAKQK